MDERCSGNSAISAGAATVCQTLCQVLGLKQQVVWAHFIGGCETEPGDSCGNRVPVETGQAAVLKWRTERSTCPSKKHAPMSRDDSERHSEQRSGMD